jgi:hypothetical protein
MVAVSVQASYELAAVGVSERDCRVLRRQLKDVDHVPTSEVSGCQVEAAAPARCRLDCLPVVGARRSRPMLSPDWREAELAFDRERDERLARGVRQRSLSCVAVLGQRERARSSAELLNDKNP